MSAAEQLKAATRSRVAPGAPAAPVRPPLQVVPPNQVGRRARRRRARLLLVTVGLLVASGMFAIVGAQVVLTQRQLRLDQVNQALAQARITNGQLALQVATLESPARIVSQAESRLDMVAPPSVVYLSPGAKPVPKVEGIPASVPPNGASSAAGAPATPAAG